MIKANNKPSLIIDSCQVGTCIDKSFEYEKKKDAIANGQLVRVGTGETVAVNRKVWQVCITNDDGFFFLNAIPADGLETGGFRGNCRLSVEQFYYPRGADTPLAVVNGFEPLPSKAK